jgi:hypothetical protein
LLLKRLPSSRMTSERVLPRNRGGVLIFPTFSDAP